MPTGNMMLVSCDGVWVGSGMRVGIVNTVWLSASLVIHTVSFGVMISCCAIVPVVDVPRPLLLLTLGLTEVIIIINVDDGEVCVEGGILKRSGKSVTNGVSADYIVAGTI